MEVCRALGSAVRSSKQSSRSHPKILNVDPLLRFQVGRFRARR
jgi:hypothetical protein